MADRPYQTEWLQNTVDAIERGSNRLLGIGATGTGKTMYFSKLPRAIGMLPWEQMVVLVHREELVFQNAEKLRLCNPDLRVGIEKAEMRADPDADVIVASVQSIGKNKVDENGQWVWCKRLQKFNPETVKCLVIDEVHHGIAASYCSVLRYFGMYRQEDRYNNPDKIFIGVTATPNRPDGIGLEVICDEIVFDSPLRSMIEQGWLVDLKAYRIDTLTDISDVSVNAGEFNTAELEGKVNTPGRNRLIVKKYLELGEEQKALAFTVDVQHAVDLAAEFRQAEKRFAAVSGATPRDERREIFRAIKRGGPDGLQGITSCGVTIEGYDEPTIGCLLMAGPTKSIIKYTQSIGRGTRPSPSPEDLAVLNERRAAALMAGRKPEPLPWIKPYCIVLDFADLSGRHQVNTLASLFGLKPDFNMKGRKVVETLEKVDRIVAKAKAPVQVEMYSSVDDLQSATERIDLFAKPTVPEVITGMSQYAWVTGVTGGFQISLESAILRVSKNMLGQYEVSRSKNGSKSVLGKANELGEALKFADAQIPAAERSILQADAKWRYLPPNDKQCNYYYNLAPKPLKASMGNDREKFREWLKGKFTSGEVSNLISQLEKRRGGWGDRKKKTAGAR